MASAEAPRTEFHSERAVQDGVWPKSRTNTYSRSPSVTPECKRRTGSIDTVSSRDSTCSEVDNGGHPILNVLFWAWDKIDAVRRTRKEKDNDLTLPRMSQTYPQKRNDNTDWREHTDAKVDAGNMAIYNDYLQSEDWGSTESSITLPLKNDDKDMNNERTSILTPGSAGSGSWGFFVNMTPPGVQINNK